MNRRGDDMSNLELLHWLIERDDDLYVGMIPVKRHKATFFISPDPTSKWAAPEATAFRVVPENNPVNEL